ncbi:MAG: STAS domain-containing protein [Sinobacteraceae bacterium]|nr:STAS domain-containing protein [Nevskiaceae bacterium]MCP5360268.1 STAS domain-containing protein [Nevskiaceae bacterium]MCP5466595.1 STAS domain-containing protein [Nevskiaceae bacterium]
MNSRMSAPSGPAWHLFVPKLYTVLRQGYDAAGFYRDLLAGLTVAIVALPLAMALAIASGSTPDKGLVTAIVAGFLISALGGSRFQIGGPTGAFVVVVYGVIAKHGYDGLVVATAMAGVLLLIAGFARLGTWIKYIPLPVVTGFTSGIAVIIASSQIADLLGLSIEDVPAEFVEKWQAYAAHLHTLNPAAVAIAAGALATIVGLRIVAPKLPGFLIAVGGASLAAWAFGLDVTTIGSRFGELPATLPAPQLPAFDLAQMRALVPSAFTIAFLAGVESLLCAVVADGMTGRRHKSNCELVAQGVANCGSALFGGLPATGAIARTATNIRAGAVSPLAGVLHALFLLLFMLVLAPLVSYIPLASLAAVLLMVAWNMSEVEQFTHLMSAPPGDRLVLLTTFGLTVLVDLTVAIEVGVVLAAMLFMHRMAEAVQEETQSTLIVQDEDDLAPAAAGRRYDRRRGLPPDVETFEMRGPFFFGVANLLSDVLDRIGQPPRLFVLVLRDVPVIDATGIGALRSFADRCRRDGTRLALVGLQSAVQGSLERMGVIPRDDVALAASLEEAVAKHAAAATAKPAGITTRQGA